MRVVLLGIIILYFLLGAGAYGSGERAKSPNIPSTPTGGIEKLVVSSVDAYRPEQITNKIVQAANEYGVNAKVALKIAYCESRYNPDAKNLHSSAKGIYQFLDGTWKWIGAKGTQFDVDENIKQFMIWFPKYPKWWSECL